MSLAAKLPVQCLSVMMDEVREICATGHHIRSENKIRVRQPLNEMKIIDPDGKFSYLAFSPDLVQIIKDEVNVKNLLLVTETYTAEL